MSDFFKKTSTSSTPFLATSGVTKKSLTSITYTDATLITKEIIDAKTKETTKIPTGIDNGRITFGFGKLKSTFSPYELVPYVKDELDDAFINDEIKKQLRGKIALMVNIVSNIIKIVHPKEVWAEEDKLKEVYGDERGMAETLVQVHLDSMLMDKVSKEQFDTSENSGKEQVDFVDLFTRKKETLYLLPKEKEIKFTNKFKIALILSNILNQIIAEIAANLIVNESGYKCDVLMSWAEGYGTKKGEWFLSPLMSLKALSLPFTKDGKTFYPVTQYSQCFIMPTGTMAIADKNGSPIYGLTVVGKKETITLEKPEETIIVPEVKKDMPIKPTDTDDLPF
jgi:hypothetical protein